MLTLGRDLAHHASQVAELVLAQSTLLPPYGELPRAFRRVPSDDTEASGMSEQRPECANRTAGNARAACGSTSPPFLSTASRLTRRDIRLHSLDAMQGETAHEPGTEQGLDVSLDSASITLECRGLDRSAVSAKESASFGLFEIPITHFLDGHANPDSVTVSRRVCAFGHSSELLAGEVARNLGRQHAVLTEHQSPGAALDVSVLDEEGLHARWLRANTESSQLRIPREYVSIRLGLERIYCTLRNLGHGPILSRVLRFPQICFPGIPGEAGEAGGKHPSENRRGWRGYGGDGQKGERPQ
jgi:hypothetical protein